ncbi:unnamed protein product [Eruca vesicaria subsp. sativa]|uniref:Uncharacterized protein n=1 Tax=Eruca vesicaria subsp. sativa TaxID=29727 RepID=A0ABC8K2Z0_ERUVS|nr:unnamed protein product [Eruca vesicaria subsp. sativa]
MHVLDYTAYPYVTQIVRLGENSLPDTTFERSEGIWRPKSIQGPEGETNTTKTQEEPPTTKDNQLSEGQTGDIEGHHNSREAMLEELQENTRKYLNCPDPVEAAARRQRVLDGEENGLTEEATADFLIRGHFEPQEQLHLGGELQELSKGVAFKQLQQATRQYLSHPDPKEAAARRHRVYFGDESRLMEEAALAMMVADTSHHQVSQRQLRISDSNPVTPPPMNEVPNHTWLLPDPPLILSPEAMEDKEDDDMESRSSNGPPQLNQPDAIQERARGKRIKSVIISPTSDKERSPQSPQANIGTTETVKATRVPHSGTKRRTKKSAARRTPRTSPNILRGTSSKNCRIKRDNKQTYSN